MKRTKKRLSSNIKKALTRKVEEDDVIDPKRLVPTGSTMLNLACSDGFSGGFPLGRIVNIIGDSSSGKTLLCLTMLAEIAGKKRFKKHKLIYDDVEEGNEFNIPTLFGSKLASRIEDEEHSDTLTNFVSRIFKLLKKGKPFIYILDSFDGLTTDEELAELKKGKKAAGFGGARKTAGLSGLLRNIKKELKGTNSLLVIVSQVRYNMNPGMFGPKLRRTGGKALKHWSAYELWLAQVKTLKKDKQVLGNLCRARISKNRLTGKIREVQFPMYYDYGVDDIGSCVTFLKEQRFWKKKGKRLNARGLGLIGAEKALIRKIEEKGLEGKLKRLTRKAWLAHEKKLRLNRKRRFQ